jgi:hypothetical protein
MPAKNVEVARVTTIVLAFSNKSVPAFVKGFESLVDQDKNITFAPAFAKKFPLGLSGLQIDMLVIS